MKILIPVILAACLFNPLRAIEVKKDSKNEATSAEHKADKRGLVEVQPSSPTILKQVVSPTPGIIYAPEKEVIATASPSQLYAKPSPHFIKISDSVLAGHPPAYANQLYQQQQVYQPLTKVGVAAQTYAVTAPIPSHLAYSKHQQFIPQQVYYQQPQIVPQHHQPIYQQQAQYLQPQQTHYHHPQYVQHYSQQPLTYNHQQQPLTYSHHQQPLAYNHQQQLTYNHQQPQQQLTYNHHQPQLAYTHQHQQLAHHQLPQYQGHITYAQPQAHLAHVAQVAYSQPQVAYAQPQTYHTQAYHPQQVAVVAQPALANVAYHAQPSVVQQQVYAAQPVVSKAGSAVSYASFSQGHSGNLQYPAQVSKLNYVQPQAALLTKQLVSPVGLHQQHNYQAQQLVYQQHH